jgi:hypothetical protein
MDPSELLIVEAAVSGAAGAFVQQVLTSGGGWLKDRFAHHSRAAQKKAAANGSAFLEELATKVQRLELESEFLREQVAHAMSQPDFTVLMQQAFLAAAQTGDPEKHTTLATIVAERLRVESDTVVALTSQMAAEAVAHLTPNQLHILAFAYTVETMRFPQPTTSVTPELLRTLEQVWVTLWLRPYEDLTCSVLDLLHLDSVGCLGARRGMLTYSDLRSLRVTPAPALKEMLQQATNLEFDYARYVESPVGARFQALYESGGINDPSLTSTGSLIGMYVADQLASRPTDATRWVESMTQREGAVVSGEQG